MHNSLYISQLNQRLIYIDAGITRPTDPWAGIMNHERNNKKRQVSLAGLHIALLSPVLLPSGWWALVWWWICATPSSWNLFWRSNSQMSESTLSAWSLSIHVPMGGCGGGSIPQSFGFAVLVYIFRRCVRVLNFQCFLLFGAPIPVRARIREKHVRLMKKNVKFMKNTWNSWKKREIHEKTWNSWKKREIHEKKREIHEKNVKFMKKNVKFMEKTWNSWKNVKFIKKREIH